MEDAYRGVKRGHRTRSSLNSRSIFRPPRVLRNLATYRGRVVRELLSHYNNDLLQQTQILTSDRSRGTRPPLFLNDTREELACEVGVPKDVSRIFMVRETRGSP